jgi:hypothetical protein
MRAPGRGRRTCMQMRLAATRTRLPCPWPPARRGVHYIPPRAYVQPDHIFGMSPGHERRHGRASRTYRIQPMHSYLSHLQSYGWVHAARATLSKYAFVCTFICSPPRDRSLNHQCSRSVPDRNCMHVSVEGTCCPPQLILSGLIMFLPLSSSLIIFLLIIFQFYDFTPMILN